MAQRPLVWVSVSFLIGVAMGGFDLVIGVWIPLAAVCAGLSILYFAPRRNRWIERALVLIFVASGVLWWNIRHTGLPGDAVSRLAAKAPVTERFSLEGRVERPDLFLKGSDWMQFFLRVDAVHRGGVARPIRGGVLVRWTEPGFAVFSGDRVRVEGPLALALSRINPGTGSYEDFLRRRGIHTALNVKGKAGVNAVSPGPWYWPAYWVSRVRGSEAELLTRVIPESSLPFVLTVWLGYRRLITDEVYRTFLESGTAHILAVSGVHMGVIYLSLSYVLSLFMKNPRSRSLVIMAVVFLFAMLAGARVSSVRAATMIAVYLAADLLDRERDAPTALGLAAMAFVAFNPDLLFDGGFQLSFLSVASILLFAEPLAETLSGRSRLVGGAVATTLSVQLLPAPIAISMFHLYPWIAPLVNLVIIPLLTFLLWLCFLTTVSAWIYEPVGVLFGHAVDVFGVLILAIVEWVSAFGIGAPVLTSPTSLAMMCYWSAAAFFGAVLVLKDHRRLWATGCGLAALLCVAFWSPWTPESGVTFIDVGDGDAVFIRTPEGRTALVDAGNRSPYTQSGKDVIAPFLWSNHVSRLDVIALSHADRDHIGGLEYIVEHFPTGALYLGSMDEESRLQQSLIDTCRRLKIPVRRVAPGDFIPLGGSVIEVLHPPADWSPEVSRNDRSLVLRVGWEGFSALLTGDIEASGEAKIIQGDCKALILKVPHHGSYTSSSVAFIEAVDPALAVMSGGRRRLGFESVSLILKRYTERGIGVYNTAIHGGIRIWASPVGLEASSARESRGYPMRLEAVFAESGGP